MLGRIHSFQSLGALDGPGLRCVVFMQGCPLRCGYCHNPDTWDISGGHPTEASAIVKKLKRYKSYFADQGGVTVSGGEALLQADFVAELFALCHEEDIHTCLDTSGCFKADQESALLEHTDLCLLDIKFTNEEDYRRYTGAELKDVLAFLGRLKEKGIPTWIRQVIVPGLNDTSANVEELNHLIAPYSNVVKVELLPFHKLCLEKYQTMGIPFPFDSYSAATQDDVAPLQALVKLPE